MCTSCSTQRQVYMKGVKDNETLNVSRLQNHSVYSYGIQAAITNPT